jgi:hypothetical protein
MKTANPLGALLRDFLVPCSAVCEHACIYELDVDLPNAANEVSLIALASRAALRNDNQGDHLLLGNSASSPLADEGIERPAA